VVVEGIHHSYEAVEPVLVDVSIVVPDGRTLALLGPSGCGKTTLLRVIAGLEVPTAGTVSVGGRTITGPGRLVPAESRRVGMVFQDWALFEHLDVAGNVGFGLPRSQRRRSPEIDEALDLVGLAGLGGRRITTLSGGQRQRVALACAVAPRPSVLLLDEPFSNLDAALRAEVRTEVHELLVGLGITTIFVTHDQDEAFVLGDEVAVISAGRVEQIGEPADLYLRPATRWVANFVGDANFVPATVGADGQRATTPFGDVDLVVAVAPGSVDILVRPEQFELAVPGDVPGGGPGDVPGAAGTVELVEYVGHSATYFVQCRGHLLRVRRAGEPIARRGDAVVVRPVPGPLVAFARPTGSPQHLDSS